MEHLPPGYDTREKAPAQHCLPCGDVLKFREAFMRWACDCGWVHQDSPQPVANLLVAINPEDQDGARIRPSTRDVDPEESSILAIKRKFPPFPGEEAFGGGFVNSFEDPRAAGVREGEEEFNLRLQLRRFLGACHPVRNSPARFAMNQIVNTWIAAVESPGELQAKDDALDAKFYTKATKPRLCFSSHEYMAGRWFNGDYKGSTDAIEISGDTYENLNAADVGQHCIRCSTPLDWNARSERWACPDTTGCKWIHWNSPAPYVRAVLIRDGQILLKESDDALVLPNAPVPAYHTPREGLELDLGAAGIETSLHMNLSAQKIDRRNRIDIVYSGGFNSRGQAGGYHTFDARQLPHELLEADRRLVEQYLSGYFETRGTKR